MVFDMTRGKIVLGACGIHLCIGSVYAWSVLTNPIKGITGWELSEITFAFSIAILFLGFSAGFLGNKVQQWGPEKSAILASMCYIMGLQGSALAIDMNNLAMLYLSYGCLGGIGLGVGYIAPVATLLKWFPNAKGFAGGCAVMSFGFSAMIAGPFIQYLISIAGVSNSLRILSTIYLFVMLCSARLLVSPKGKNNEYRVTINKKKNNTIDVSVDKAFRTTDFWLLWTIFFINISCGIAVLSIASPMAQKIGMSAVEAAGMVGMIGLLNGGGRIFFASVSDYIGRGVTHITFFLIEIFAFYILSITDNPYLFQSVVFVIVSCYGGGFSCMPAYIADIFGTKYLSAIHGRILTAWGLAGIFGPLVITKCYEHFGNHSFSLQLFSGLFVLSLAMAVLLYKRNK